MIRPCTLKVNDKIAFVAPAGKIVKGSLNHALAKLNDWGLNVELGENIQKEQHYFAGTDRERLADFQKALDNPEIKAIFCARGGYGTTRILDKINFEGFKNNPKWIIGFSDITALHFHVHNMGIESIHSVMPSGFGTAHEQSIESLRKIVFGETISYKLQSNALNRNGTITTSIIGGNLSLITDSLGTASEIDFDHKILFIEEIDEYLYKIDRMMVQLKRAGKLENLAGLVVGHMSTMKDTTVPFGKSANELIMEHVSKYNYPIAFNIPIGHEALNIAIPCSRACELKVSDSAVEFNFEKN